MGCWLLVTGPAQAADQRQPIRWGQWKLWTEWALDLELNNNLRLAHDHDISKALYVLRPSLHLRRDFWSASHLCLDYTAMVAVQEDSSPLVEQFSNDDWWSNSLAVDLRVGGLVGSYFTAQGLFQRTSDRQGSDNLYRLGLKTSRRFSRLRAALGYGFGLASRLEVNIGYVHREYDAPEDEPQNQKTYQAGVTYMRRLGRRLWWLAQYRLSRRDFLDQEHTRQEDYFQHAIMAGVRLMPGRRWVGVAKAGMAWRHYRDPENPQGETLENGADWVAQVYLDYTPVPGTHIRLDFTRGLLEAPFNGLDYDYLTANRVTLELRQAMGEGVEFFGAMAFGRWDYNPLGPSPSLHDHFFEAGMGFTCQLKYGAFVRAAWLLDHRAAGDDAMSYTNQRYILTLGWRR